MSRTEMITLNNGSIDVKWFNEDGSFTLIKHNNDKETIIELSPKEAADLATFMVEYLFEYIE